VVPSAVVALSNLGDVQRLFVLEGPALAHAADLIACSDHEGLE
jgi:hypothetical protein